MKPITIRWNKPIPVWDHKPWTAVRIACWYVMKVLTHNFWMKVLAVFFAILLWGVILTSTNPETTKNFSGLSVTVVGESALHSAGYAMLTSPSDINLQGVTVSVGVGFNDFNSLTDSSIDVSVDLSNIHSKGKHNVKLIATCNTPNVTIKSIYPAYISVEIDSFANKRINLSSKFEGTLPGTIWRGEAIVDPQSIMVSGPKSIVSRIIGAYAVIDQSTLKNPLRGDTYPVEYYDANQQTVSSDLVRTSSLAAVTMDVQAKRVLKLDLDGSLQNKDSMKAGYGVLSQSYTYDTPTGDNYITLIGSNDVIESMGDIVRCESIDLSGRSTSLHVTRKLLLPAGVTAVYGDKVDVTVNIDEQIISRTLLTTVHINNPNWRSYSATAAVTQVNVTVTGLYSKVNRLTSSSLTANLDVSSVGEGTHEVPVKISGLPSGTSAAMASTTIQVTVKKR